MNISCNKEKIIQALQATEKISRKNISLPILSKIYILADKNGLNIRATNLTVGVEVTVSAVVEEDGGVVVDGGVLLSLLQQIKRAEKVILKTEDNSLKIEATGTSLKVQIYPVDDFPTLPHVDSDRVGVIDIGVFVDAVRSVVYSAAVSDIKPEIASVYVYPDAEKTVFVATDSFRLAEKQVDGFLLEGGIEPMLLPAKSLEEVVRIFDGQSGEADFYLADNLIEIKMSGVSVTQRLLDGSFPDYRLIIPKEFSTEAILIKQEMVDQVKLITLFSDKFQQLDLSLDPENKKMIFSANNSEVGSGKVELVSTLKGESVDIRLNHRYLLDGFQSIDEDSVELLFSGERKPVVIRGVGDKSFTYLVMPMNR